MNADNAVSGKVNYSETAAARYLGVSKRTIRDLPIPRLEILRDDTPNKDGYVRKRRFIRYEKANLDKFKSSPW